MSLTCQGDYAQSVDDDKATHDATEVKPAPLTEVEEAVWRALSRMMVVLPNVLERDLRVAGGLTLNEYVVLVNLSEHDDRSMRMSELAAVSILSSSGITRLVERLEGWGLIKRVRDPADGRGQRALLTETGLARLQVAYPHHLRGVRTHVMDHLAGLDLQALATALSKVAADEPGPALHGNRRPAKGL